MSRYRAKYTKTEHYKKFKFFAQMGDAILEQIVDEHYKHVPRRIYSRINPKASCAIQVFASNEFLVNFGKPYKPKFLECGRITSTGKIGDMVEAYIYLLYRMRGYSYVERWVNKKIREIVLNKTNIEL